MGVSVIGRLSRIWWTIRVMQYSADTLTINLINGINSMSQVKEEKIIPEKKQQVLSGYKCDCCEATAKPSDRHGNLPIGWHGIHAIDNYGPGMECYSEWEYDVCSPKCYIKTLKYLTQDLLNDRGHKKSDVTIDDMTFDFAANLVTFFDNKTGDDHG